MFAKVYQYKFPGVSEAKVAASYCSDKLGKKIVEFDFEGLNIMIGKDGDLSIIILQRKGMTKNNGSSNKKNTIALL